jgi:hypothetical protein
MPLVITTVAGTRPAAGVLLHAARAPDGAMPSTPQRWRARNQSPAIGGRDLYVRTREPFCITPCLHSAVRGASTTALHGSGRSKRRTPRRICLLVRSLMANSFSLASEAVIRITRSHVCLLLLGRRRVAKSARKGRPRGKFRETARMPAGGRERGEPSVSTPTRFPGRLPP